MARVELPSGAWVDYRTELMAGDRFVVQDAVKIDMGEGGIRTFSLGTENDQRNALLARVITNWSYPGLKPDANDVATGALIIGNTMPLQDYNVLSKEVEPLLKEISGFISTDDPKDSSAS